MLPKRYSPELKTQLIKTSFFLIIQIIVVAIALWINSIYPQIINTLMIIIIIRMVLFQNQTKELRKKIDEQVRKNANKK